MRTRQGQISWLPFPGSNQDVAGDEMKKEYIDLLLDEIKKDLLNHNPPYVRTRQTISVEYDFFNGHIPKVKIIAP